MQEFFRGRGVVADTGTVVYRDGRRIDVASTIDVELKKEGDEYLHLQFLAPRCTVVGFELPFSGSRIGRGEEGSADELRGLVAVEADGTFRVSIES
jgi:hypothetical protein